MGKFRSNKQMNPCMVSLLLFSDTIHIVSYCTLLYIIINHNIIYICTYTVTYLYHAYLVDIILLNTQWHMRGRCLVLFQEINVTCSLEWQSFTEASNPL